MDNYIKGPVLGKGTFGEVIKATHKETGAIVAIKKIRIGEKGEGVNVTALREVRLLRELTSPHIVKLIDVFTHKKGICLVFEFMETDLETIIKDKTIVLSAGDIKAYMHMILSALDTCHSQWIVHRDIKPNNFLVATDGSLRLADFGLSKLYGSPERPFTNQVFARWYRPPELFYGSTCYGPGVDIWAAGCVFAELILRRPWFPGESDVEVLTKIFMALGTPLDDNWGGLKHMPAFVEFQKTHAPPLETLFPTAGEDALDLLTKMLSFDPTKRISAGDALRHRYFRLEPEATVIEKLPKPRSQSLVGGGGSGAGVNDTSTTAANNNGDDNNDGVIHAGQMQKGGGLKRSRLDLINEESDKGTGGGGGEEDDRNVKTRRLDSLFDGV